MLKILVQVIGLLVPLQTALATVLFLVGTTDGRLVCEDTRILNTSNGEYFDSYHKTQQLGSGGLFSVVGAIRQGQGGLLNFDILEAVPRFFRTTDINTFISSSSYDAWRFESFLKDELRKGLVFKLGATPTNSVIVFLYWFDADKHPKIYFTVATDEWSLSSLGLSLSTDAIVSLPVTGRLLLDSNFETTKPLIYGDGKLVYDEIKEGTKVEFEAARQDKTLRPFISEYVSVDSITALEATAAIKKLITIISDKQDLVRANIGVGPTSDCYLLSPKEGIKDMNEALENYQAEQLKKAELEAASKKENSTKRKRRRLLFH